MNRNNNGRIIRNIIIYVVFIVMAFVSLFPILYCVSASLRTQQNLTESMLPFTIWSIIPKKITFENYIMIFAKYDFWRPMINTLIVTVFTIIFGCILNALAASAIAYFAGITPEVIGEAIRNFGGVEHRIEYCGSLDGVDYYNDSKGTNSDAAIIALKALQNGIILIAGGDGKSQDFTEFANHLKGSVEALVLLGRDAPIIEEAARKAGYTNIYNCKDMEECVSKATEIAKPGEKVLLSPACASWDMYANFEQRGRHFKECVEKMLK